MYSLTKFSLSDMTEYGTVLRKLGAGAKSMEEVANRVVHHLYEAFLDERTGEPALALVRFFKTHPYADLIVPLPTIAQTMVGNSPIPPTTQCLTLLATTGQRPEWQSRQASKGHQVIPLMSEQLVTQLPMISQLIQQFGLEVNAVVSPNPDLLIDLEQTTFNVFHVEHAIASPYVPAQDNFVVPYGIRSVLGFGGMLPSGNLIAVILFSKVLISRDTAELFKTLALNVKMAVLPFDRGRVFA